MTQFTLCANAGIGRRKECIAWIAETMQIKGESREADVKALHIFTHSLELSITRRKYAIQEIYRTKASRDRNVRRRL